jgi:protochlorophyllide reductase
MPAFSINQLPDLSGKTAIVTGANSGLGLETARVLALMGAHVVMACRNLEKAHAAKTRMASAGMADRLELRELDLASLESVRTFAQGIRDDYEQLDILVNNAGVMALPRMTTADGFEMQFGTNHLGHFALTGLLFDLLQRAPEARVVCVTSVAAVTGKINFDDLMGEKRYTRYGAYSQSKLANLLHARELDRRMRKAGGGIKGIAAHPGFTATELQRNTAKASGNPVEGLTYSIFIPMLGMPVEKGTLPQLYAAAMPDAKGGAMYGPDGIQQVWGWPAEVKQPRRAKNEETARKLWEVSQELTGVEYG